MFFDNIKNLWRHEDGFAVCVIFQYDRIEPMYKDILVNSKKIGMFLMHLIKILLQRSLEER